MHIFILDLQTGIPKLIRSGDGYYYGITCKDDKIALTHTAGYLQVYKIGQKALTTWRNLIDPHQCEWVEDRILAANTGGNCISVYDQSGRWLKDVYLNEIHSDRKDGLRIGNHFNSVHRQADQVYVIAHNYERPSEIYTLTWPELDIAQIQKINANWAHNVWSGDLGLVTCDSRHGRLVEIKSGEVIWDSNDDQALTRGLAVNGNHIFVGCSSQTIRKDRYWTSGGVWIVDRRSLQTIEKIELPGSGQVHEIRIVGEVDECHNGQTLTYEMLAGIRRKSLIADLALNLRRRNPAFQKDLPVISQLVRARQITSAKLRTLQDQK